MRLICPNCGAQYEVPVDVIPEAGRDVQCSSCGTTWFQPHPDSDTALPDAPEELIDTNPEPEFDAPVADQADDDWEEEWSRDTPSQASAVGIAAGEQDSYEEDYEDELATKADASPLRRQLDPGVADLLREEAEREARARAAERQPDNLETQPELGLSEPEDEASRRTREARERMARMRGEEIAPSSSGAAVTKSVAASAAAMKTASPGTGSRRDLLPDIDEINSTLRSSSDRRAPEADDHMTPGEVAAPRGTAKAQSGFRRGFFIALLIAALLACLYVYADDMIRLVPALKGPLEGFVRFIDGLRLWLDGQMKDLLMWLDSMASETPAT